METWSAKPIMIAIRSAFSGIHVNFSKISSRIYRVERMTRRRCEKILSSLTDNSLMANGRRTQTGVRATRI